MTPPTFRRVVTGHDPDGAAVFLSDGTPPHTVSMPDGMGVSDLLWLDGPPRTPDDGEDRDGAFDLEPPPGGLSVRIISIPTARRGRDATPNGGSVSPARTPSVRACTPPTRSTS